MYNPNTLRYWAINSLDYGRVVIYINKRFFRVEWESESGKDWVKVRIEGEVGVIIWSVYLPIWSIGPEYEWYTPFKTIVAAPRGREVIVGDMNLYYSY